MCVYIKLTNTRIYGTLSDTPLEETRTTIATLGTIVFSWTSIRTHTTQLGIKQFRSKGLWNCFHAQCLLKLERLTTRSIGSFLFISKHIKLYLYYPHFNGKYSLPLKWSLDDNKTWFNNLISLRFICQSALALHSETRHKTSYTQISLWWCYALRALFPFEIIRKQTLQRRLRMKRMLPIHNY